MIRLDTQILQISDNRTPGIYLPFPQKPRLCVTASCNRLIGCPTSRHLVWLPKCEKSHTCFWHSLTDMCRPASVVSMILHPRAEFLEMNILRKKKCLAQAASYCSPHNVCSGAAEISVVFGYLFVCLECPTLSVFGGAVGSGKGTQQRLLFFLFFFFSPLVFSEEALWSCCLSRFLWFWSGSWFRGLLGLRAACEFSIQCRLPGSFVVLIFVIFLSFFNF